MKIIITEEQFKHILKATLNEENPNISASMYPNEDMPYNKVAEKVWAGEIEAIESIHDPKENIVQVGNATGNEPWETCGRIFRGVETGKYYFLEL